MLKKLLENFTKDGLAIVQVENVDFSIKNILNVCGSLLEVQKLPTKTPNYILSWLTLCSVEKFKQPLVLLLNQYQFNEMSRSVVMSDTSEFTLEWVKYICLKPII